MAVSFKHAFNSAKVDGTDSTLIQPSNWNAEHVITLGAGKLLGRDAGSSGAVQEIAIAVDATQQSMIPPSGSTAARPATALAGMLRYNTSLSQFEGYYNSVWNQFPSLNGSNTFTGAMTLSGSGSSYRFRISSTAGNGKYAVFQSNGSTRWELGSNSTAETGSNSGADFIISRYDDAGTFLDTPVYIDRTDGSIDVLSDFAIGGATGVSSTYITGGAGNNRTLYFQSNYSSRWSVRANSDSESGSNLGSNFELNRYDDSGTNLGTAISIGRATGNVGIGTTPTTNKLEVSGAAQATTFEVGNASDTTISRSAAGVIAVEGGIVPLENRANTFTASQTISSGALIVGSASDQFNASVSGTTTSAQFGASSSGGHFKVYYDRASGGAYFRIGTIASPIDAVTIGASGNVGIGAAPAAKFDVIGADDTQVIFRNTSAIFRVRPYITGLGYTQLAALNSAGSAYAPLAVGGSITTLETGGTERMRIDASGNVGIGTATARNQAHVSGAGQQTSALTDAGARGGMLRVSDTSALGGAGGAILFANGQGDTANSLGFAAIKGLLFDGTNNTAGYLAISLRTSSTDTALTERVRIDNQGNVGIGTAAPVAAFQGQTPRAGIEAPRTAADQTLLTLAHTGTISSSDAINIGFDSYSSTAVRRTMAQISAINENPSAGNPGSLAFFTNAGAAALTKRVTIDSAGNVLNVSSGGLGYGTGSGGTVTQITSKATGVTINKTNGQIITHNAALNGGVAVSFAVTNSTMAATDTVVLNCTNGNYSARVFNNAAGSFSISLKNETGGSLSDAVTLNFAIIKTVTS